MATALKVINVTLDEGQIKEIIDGVIEPTLNRIIDIHDEGRAKGWPDHYTIETIMQFVAKGIAELEGKKRGMDRCDEQK